jgi:hypothetical protein
MPIPRFTDDGLLPPGLHVATLDEVVARFGSPGLQRRAIAESLEWAVQAACRAGIARFVIDGSFVDSKAEPNDADCILLLGHDYPRDDQAARAIEQGFPYVQMIFFEEPGEFEEFMHGQFETDRCGRTRGLVEVRL